MDLRNKEGGRDIERKKEKKDRRCGRTDERRGAEKETTQKERKHGGNQERYIRRV